MKISVVTVCRNAGGLLGATLQSIVAQRGVDIESIIVDGASTDGTVDVISRFAAESPVPIKWVSEPDRGVYHAVNKGIAMASGDVVGLLHAGDRFSNHDVLGVVSGAFDDPALGFVYGDVSFVGSSGGRRVRVYRADRFKPGLLLNGYAPPHPSLYMRRGIFTSVGRYKEDYAVAADFEYFVRLMLVADCIKSRYLPINMVDMEPGGLSSRLVNRLWLNNKEKLRALRENGFKINPFRLLFRYLYL